jgi:hypothetical protein
MKRAGVHRHHNRLAALGMTSTVSGLAAAGPWRFTPTAVTGVAGLLLFSKEILALAGTLLALL